MTTAWPKGKERQRVGEISVTTPLNVQIAFDDIDDVESLDMILVGEKCSIYSRKLPVEEHFSLQLTEEDVAEAERIDASLYVITATLKDESKRIVTKGRVNWQTGTRK